MEAFDELTVPSNCQGTEGGLFQLGTAGFDEISLVAKSAPDVRQTGMGDVTRKLQDSNLVSYQARPNWPLATAAKVHFQPRAPRDVLRQCMLPTQNMVNVLITGGRSAVALDWGRRLIKAGHKIIIADSLSLFLCQAYFWPTRIARIPEPNGDQDTFKRALLDLISKHSIHVVLPTCEETLFVSSVLADVSSCKVFTADVATLDKLHNKFTFNQWVRDEGLAAPRSYLCSSLEQVEDALASCFESTEPFVMKPAYSRGSSRTLICRDRSRVAALALNKIEISHSNPWVLQEFIAGTELCSYSICLNGEILAHAVYTHQFHSGAGAGIQFISVADPSVDQWCAAFVGKLGFTGQIAFDFIKKSSDGVLLPLECNPRSTSGLHMMPPGKGITEILTVSFPVAELPGWEDSSDVVNEETLIEIDSQDTVIAPVLGTQSMVLFALLLLGPAQIDSWAKLKQFFSVLYGSKDVTLSKWNPLPIIWQIFIAFHAFFLSLYYGISMMEVFTRDISWNGYLQPVKLVETE